jgi:transcriptional regulator with XRE-family HTH domain
MDTVGKRIRIARNRLVWTQEDLAKATGLTNVTISRLENDQIEGTPRQSTLRKLGAALGVDPAWLVFGGDMIQENASEGKRAA